MTPLSETSKSICQQFGDRGTRQNPQDENENNREARTFAELAKVRAARAAEMGIISQILRSGRNSDHDSPPRGTFEPASKWKEYEAFHYRQLLHLKPVPRDAVAAKWAREHLASKLNPWSVRIPAHG
ncbi:hypothetical protein EVAR_50200_1 [Eumeta japonica]|uniref:Uncharacterized protein n=1 Tax=Eumeta variegata TaxID=151549 RepID=A0A4C1X0C3_EUMVA|nr:hypothetical protein EVAR_50200_1 [Eumeta japonica]